MIPPILARSVGRSPVGATHVSVSTVSLQVSTRRSGRLRSASRSGLTPITHARPWSTTAVTISSMSSSRSSDQTSRRLAQGSFRDADSRTSHARSGSRHPEEDVAERAPNALGRRRVTTPDRLGFDGLSRQPSRTPVGRHPWLEVAVDGQPPDAICGETEPSSHRVFGHQVGLRNFHNSLHPSHLRIMPTAHGALRNTRPGECRVRGSDTAATCGVRSLGRSGTRRHQTSVQRPALPIAISAARRPRQRRPACSQWVQSGCLAVAATVDSLVFGEPSG